MQWAKSRLARLVRTHAIAAPLVFAASAGAALQPGGDAPARDPRHQVGKPEGVRAAVEIARESSGEAFVRARLLELDSKDTSVRDRASRELSSREDVTLDVVERVLQGTLTLEQRRRLEGVGYEKFVKRPRPALGITFADAFAQESVSIRGPVDGFDSARVLQADDTFYAMGGMVIRGTNDARLVITSYVPGEWTPIHLFRHGEPVLIHVRLGQFRDLPRQDAANQRAGVPNDNEGPSMLRQAWAVRLSRGQAALPAPRAIDLGVHEQQLALLQGAREEPHRPVRPAQRGPRLINQANIIRPVEKVDESDVASVALGGASGLVNEPSRMPYRQNTGENPEVQQILMRMQELDEEIAQLERQAAQMPEAVRRALRDQIADRQRERDKLKLHLSGGK